MTMSNRASSSIRHYFVDEAGDGFLFDEAGRVRVGTPGCSHYFILGVLDVPNPTSLAHDLEQLRLGLLGDPYFKKVPSMQPEQKKTALAFHAKNDVPEVRREDRYVELLWPSFSVVHDLDDTRRNLYGEYYTKGKPLTSAALEDLPGDIGSNSRN